ncbi:hypothetical protein SOM10_02685 [Microbacterium sp. CFBP9023]|jgi:hypothetical protein|uniref:hypothetical protein n=1 Tax=unclassified Microbacterium TaxID=2609290 RepID=UPI00069EFF30|nr:MULTISPECIES: hypothetical protein [unclassified Microbacterium]AKV85562.1 hypothetical protein AKG07_03815 [Microbacterium sp. CGR1]MDY0982788.1 hypothetical protein [Microbacterium sp. CFBP9023]
MQKIIYAGDEYLTGDAIADALLAYSRALGDDERAEIVEIPVRENDGGTAVAKFLIGPASQIVSKEAAGEGPEIEDPELVERLRQRTRSIESPTSQPLEIEYPPGYDLE